MDKIIKGSTGTLIEKWQRFLKFMGYDIGKFGANKDGIDGEFGSTGIRVTNEYKKAIGMAEDGTVDLETALNVIERLITEIRNLKSTIAENTTNSNNKIAELKQQVSDLNVQLQGKNSTITDMQGSLSEITAQFEMQEKELEDSEMKVVEFANKVGALETENSILLNNSKEYEGEIIDLTQKSELQKAKYLEVMSESTVYVQEIDKLNCKILVMQAEIESMRKVKPTEIVIPKQSLSELLRRLFRTK
jgi:chromosome segregation ATPase